MKIAILGATSQIAQDLIREWSATRSDIKLYLFARDTVKLRNFIASLHNRVECAIDEICSFSSTLTIFDVVINFIGVGDPSKIKEMASSIMYITFHYDDQVIEYLKKNLECKYIFLSSGAAYGDSFSEPVTEKSLAKFNINDLSVVDNYGLAKLVSEAKHRSHTDLCIYDVRVFNYFSRYQDTSSRFFITDVFRAIQNKTVLTVSPEDIVRDFIHPKDFTQMINVILDDSTKHNFALDCYTKCSVSKFELLEYMRRAFCLQWDVIGDADIVNATGTKSKYYSLNHKAEMLGYNPAYSSLDCLQEEFSALIHVM